MSFFHPDRMKMLGDDSRGRGGASGYPPEERSRGPPPSNGSSRGRRSRSRSGSRPKKRKSRSRSGSRNRSRDRKKKDKERRKSKDKDDKKKKKSSNWDRPPDPFNPNALANSLTAFRAAQPSVLQDRRCRRVYVGGFTPDISEEQLRVFFDQTLRKVPGRVITPGVNDFAVKSVNINREKNYAFLEFFDKDDATIIISMDGIQYNGASLALRRPKEYHDAVASGQLMEEMPKGIILPGLMNQAVPDGPDKVFIGNIPLSLTDEEVKAFVGSYGELKVFQLAKEPGTNISKGYGFFKYTDPSVTEDAVEGLNGITIGQNIIVVSLPSKGQRDANGIAGLITFTPAPTSFDPTALGLTPPTPPTRVLVLQNMVTRQELLDDQEYTDINEDIKEEMAKYGSVISVFIPRPGKDLDSIIGKVFCEFVDLKGSQMAEQGMKGKKFAGRVIVTTFMSESDFKDRKFS